MPVSILSSVDLPLPDGPLTANKLCAGMVKVTSSRMIVRCARVTMARVSCSTRINGLLCGNVAGCFDAVVCAMSRSPSELGLGLPDVSEPFGFVMQSMPGSRRSVIRPRAERDQSGG